MVWLTAAGLQGAGLGGVRAVRSPPAPTTIAHGVLVGWPAGRAQHNQRVWKSARELALDSEPWAVTTRRERGYTEQLPDLVVWLDSTKAPGAVIAEQGGRREDRRKMILEGWRDAIWCGRYVAVRYECAGESVARWIARLAKQVGLTDSQSKASVQTTAEQIAALSPTAFDETTATYGPIPDDEAQITSARARVPAEPVRLTPPEPAPTPESETVNTAECERHALAGHLRQPLGIRGECWWTNWAKRSTVSTMKPVSIHEAKTQFSRLVSRAEQGEEIVVRRGPVPVAKIVAYHAPTTPRRPGALKGQIQIAPDFDELPVAFDDYTR